MSSNKIILTVGIVAIAAGGFGAWKYLEQSKQDNIEHRAAAESFLDKQLEMNKQAITEFKDARVSSDGTITIKGLNVFPHDGKNAYTVEKMVVHKFDKQNQPPNFAHVSVSGAKVSSNNIPNPQAKFFISQLGYDDLFVDADIDYDYKPEKKSANIAMDLSLRDAVAIKLNLQLENIDKNMMQANSSANTPKQLPVNTSIKHAKLSITDQSLLGRVMKMVPPQTQDMILQNLDLQIDNAPTETDRETMVAVRNFLKNQGSITFSIDPPNPVTLLEIQQMQATNPQAIPGLLNISVTN
jgi:hypothetical protein